MRRTMPHSARSVVVLPAPLAPSSAVMPPSASEKRDLLQRLRRPVEGIEIADFEEGGHGRPPSVSDLGSDTGRTTLDAGIRRDGRRGGVRANGV